MEKAGGIEEAGQSPTLPPASPVIPPNVKPEHVDLPIPKHSIINRRGVGNNGRRINLLTNHFKVSVNVPDAVFDQYTVTISEEDKRSVEGKGIVRFVVDRLRQKYTSELAGKRFAYDGERSLYTVGPLPQNKFEFTAVLEESRAKQESGGGSPIGGGKRSKHSFQSKTFKVEISYAAKIPLKSIALTPKGNEVDNTAQDALRVLVIVLRQQEANRGCLLVRQSFFHDDTRNFADVGGGVSGVQGFHSSFRPTQGGLSLNMDVCETRYIDRAKFIERPFTLIEEDQQSRRANPVVRVEKMFEQITEKLPGAPQFILCVLPERKNSDIYGP